MCLIIETRKDIHIPKFVMDDMYKRNDDGFGFMYLRNGHVVGEKYEGKTADELYDMYERLKEYQPYIHLRMKTHGDINPEQSHPFYCGHGIWMMHNGILSDVQGEDKTKSDTWYFANEYLKPVFDQAKDPDELVKTPAFQYLINRVIGSGNKVVIMGPKAGAWRFSPSSWHVIDNEETKCVGMRVSNTYAWDLWKPKPKYPATSYYPAVHRNSRHNDFRDKSKIVTPPGGNKNPSHKGDPAGSFRDDNDELWVFNGLGWISWKTYQACFPNAKPSIYTTFTKTDEGEEVPHANPIQSGSQKTVVSDSQKSGTVNVNEPPKENLKKEGSGVKKVPSFIDVDFDDAEDEKQYNMDVYQDWLFGHWQELDYWAIRRRVIEHPEEAADVIALALGVDLDTGNGI